MNTGSCTSCQSTASYTQSPYSQVNSDNQVNSVNGKQNTAETQRMDMQRMWEQQQQATLRHDPMRLLDIVA